MVQQSSIKRALTSSKQDKWPKHTSDPLCPLTASNVLGQGNTNARIQEFLSGGRGGTGGMQVHLTQTSLTILFWGDKGGGGG